MTITEKLRVLARELGGEAWDYERRGLPAQAYVRRRAAGVLMTQARTIQREDAMFEDPPARAGVSRTGSAGSRARPRSIPSS